MSAWVRGRIVTLAVGLIAATALGGESIGEWLAEIHSVDRQQKLARFYAAPDIRNSQDIDSLIATLSDPDASVRQAVCSALGQVQVLPDRAAAALVKALIEDSDSGVQRHAATALIQIGAPGVPAVTALLGTNPPVETKMVKGSVSKTLKYLGAVS